MLFQKTPLLLLLLVSLLLVSSSPANAQLCISAAQDDETCIQTVGDDADHCAWCSLSGFGFCVSYTQAETFEQSIPGVDCDRFAGDDDAAPIPADDDGNIAPTGNIFSQDQDPFDPACLNAYLQDPTQAGCEAAADKDGNPCEWCSLPARGGVGDVCLTKRTIALWLVNHIKIGMTPSAAIYPAYSTVCAALVGRMVASRRGYVQEVVRRL
jgi:hypothetical protein